VADILPTRAEEDWRYADVKALADLWPLPEREPSPFRLAAPLRAPSCKPKAA
jgi:hypothetical protein